MLDSTIHICAYDIFNDATAGKIYDPKSVLDSG